MVVVYFHDRSQLCCSTRPRLPTALARQLMQSPPSVRPSVCTLTFEPSDPLTLTVTVCMCMAHDHSSHGTEDQGQRSRLGLGLGYGLSSNRGRWDLDPQSRTLF